MIRLNNGYGIGVIKLNIENPEESEIIVSAREREIADIKFMNFLSNNNIDFYTFVDNIKDIILTKEIDQTKYDTIPKPIPTFTS